MDPLAFMTALARDAGALLRERLDGPREIAEKRAHDLVTDADRASEALIVARIGAAFPSASILGEESGAHAGSGDERFIVDPLDGTTNYAHGYPLFCVSIAYERAGVVEAGAIHAPVLDELYAARRGGGATCNGRPIAVSAVARVGAAMVCTGFDPARYARNGRYFAALSRHAQAVRRDGSAALDLAFVAAGRYDAFWEWDLKPWDVAAGALDRARGRRGGERPARRPARPHGRLGAGQQRPAARRDAELARRGPERVRMESDRDPAAGDEMVVVSRAALERLQTQIDGLPQVFAQLSRDLGKSLAERLSGALDDLSAQLLETTDDALRAIRDAIPAVLAQHAPDTPPEALEAITEAIYARAAERFATLHAAQRLLSRRLADAAPE